MNQEALVRGLYTGAYKNYTDQIKEDEMGGALGRMGEMRNTYKILFGKPEEKRTLGRPKRR
jgi:hypothetical protein